MEAEEQVGFRAGRWAVDHLYCVTQITEKKAPFDQEIHLTLRRSTKSLRYYSPSQIMVNIGTDKHELIKAVQNNVYQ